KVHSVGGTAETTGSVPRHSHGEPVVERTGDPLSERTRQRRNRHLSSADHHDLWTLGEKLDAASDVVPGNTAPSIDANHELPRRLSKPQVQRGGNGPRRVLQNAPTSYRTNLQPLRNDLLGPVVG